jgi:hypothetical protein
MNFTESFSEFSSKIGPTDLALYAGAGIILWVLFKDKMTPVQKIINDIVEQIKGKKDPVKDKVDKIIEEIKDTESDQGLFFDLVVSWKQTRDLAEKSGCAKAVEVADQMFPYLSPMVCEDVDNEE